MSVTTRSFLDQLCAAGLISQADLTRMDLSHGDSVAAAPAEISRLAGAHLLTGFQAKRATSLGYDSLLYGGYVVVDQLEDRPDRQRYKARCIEDGRDIALHVFPGGGDTISDPAHPQGEHPYVATVLETGLCNDQRFVATQLIEGDDLRTVVGQCGPLPLEDAVVCVTQAAQGLAWLYSRQAPPRDIGPQHVLLDEAGNARVLSCELYYGQAATTEMDGDFSIATISSLRGLLLYLLTGQEKAAVSAEQLNETLSGCESSLDVASAGQLVEKLETELKELFAPLQTITADTSAAQHAPAEEVVTQPVTDASGLTKGLAVGGVLLTLLIGVIAAILWALSSTSS